MSTNFLAVAIFLPKKFFEKNLLFRIVSSENTLHCESFIFVKKAKILFRFCVRKKNGMTKFCISLIVTPIVLQERQKYTVALPFPKTSKKVILVDGNKMLESAADSKTF